MQFRAYQRMNRPLLNWITVACIVGQSIVWAELPAKTKRASSPQVAASLPQQEVYGYRIGVGDILQINVWKEPEVSLDSVVVRSDGRISVPLLKEVKVIGLTPAELEKALIEKLSHLIRDADVTVVVKEIHSEKVYVIGAVKNEGPIPFHSGMTVLQAIAQTGGLAEWAKRSKIYTLRNINGKQVKLPFNYQAVVKGERMEENITILPDDTIVVP